MQMIEMLETRSLFSATAGFDLANHVTLDNGSLVVTGTASADNISLKDVGSKIRVAIDGAVEYLKAHGVKSITISAGSGNDDVTTNTLLGVTVDGGSGNDSISTGSGNDTVNGGAGNDTITSGAGNDTDSGGTGNDYINAGAGTNLLFGGNGDDTLVVTSQSHGSHLFGGAGDDLLETNTDTMAQIDGGTGDDSFSGSFHGKALGIEIDLDVKGSHGSDDSNSSDPSSTDSSDNSSSDISSSSTDSPSDSASSGHSDLFGS